MIEVPGATGGGWDLWLGESDSIGPHGASPLRASDDLTAMRPAMSRARVIAGVVAGPLLIVASVLMVLRRYAFTGLISTEDLLRYWLPMYDFLSESLKSGHIPGWNPYVIGGTPFAADPQSGWMQVLPMILFTILPVGAGLRWFVVIQPMIAGLGLYAFLRSEGTSRPAATIGGLALALVVAGSNLPVSVRFPGILAWTAVALAACSRYLRADRWSRRIMWGLATVLAWGQVAASHPTVGMLLGSGALVAFILAKTLSNVRSGEWRGRTILPLGGLLVVAFPLVNLAYLLPRLALGPKTSVSLGYGRLNELSRELTGTASPPFPGLAADPKWPLNLATFPGRYLGAVALLAVFAGLWSRRHRYLAGAFAAYGVACYGLGLKAIAYRTPSSVRSFPLVDQYLHHPYWISFGVLLAIGVMAGLGVDAWRDAGSSRRRVLMILPAVGLWLLLPVSLEARPSELLLLAVASGVAAIVLVIAIRRPAAMVALPVILVGEIVLTTVVGNARLPFKGDLKLLARLESPTASIAEYLSPTSLSRVLAENPGDRYYAASSLPGQIYLDRRALQNDESMVLRLENVGGYQAVQLERYWLFVRRLQQVRMKYQYSLFVNPPSTVSDLLDVGWVIAPEWMQVDPALVHIADEDRWILYRDQRPRARATVATSWNVVGSPEEALEAVADPGFDPTRVAILEEDPGIELGPASPSAGTATYRSLGPQTARIDVTLDRPAIVVIRHVWDGNWRATVNGKPAPVLAADYLVHGVPVPAGRHTVLLTYDDPTIGYGMLGSSIAVAALLSWAAVRRRQERGSRAEDGPAHPQ